MTGLWRMRAAVLTLVGALGVHHGRYLFASPEHVHELAGAHAYLGWLAPLSAALVLLAAVELVGRLGRATSRRAPELPSTGALWLVATIALVGAFVTQETLEALSVHGQLPLLGDVLGGGGWTALPFAVAGGGVVALLLRGAAAAVRWALARSARAPRRARPLVLVPRQVVLVAPRGVLARSLAGRGPPALVLGS